MKKSYKSVTCIAPINIAVVKYWGKADEKYNIPLNPSLSVTLDSDDLCTKTTISLDESLEDDQLWLNGRKEDISENKRIQRCLQEARRLCRKRKAEDESLTENPDDLFLKLKCSIVSTNNFPTAAGLASSASGYACLAKCLGEIFELKVDLSALARLGSGSACRSMDGGFVKWNKGSCPAGTDSIAEQIASEDHWDDLRCLILVVSNKQKSVSSTEGMKRSVETSELLKHRVNKIVDERMSSLEKAILEKDFETFSMLTMKDSNQLHAICQDTYPPIVPPYMNAISHAIVKLVTDFNIPSVKAAYTFDAGANAVVFTLVQHFDELLSTIIKYFPSNKSDFINLSAERLEHLKNKSVNLENCLTLNDALDRIIVTKPGKGAHVVAME